MPRRPSDQQRTIVLGRTGAGKTQFAVGELLANANWHEMPWVIIDYKGDDIVTELRKLCPNIKEIKPSQKPPTKPGLYWMQPAPQVDDGLVEAWLMQVWKQGYVGLYVDEGYALPNGAGFNIILTQGRSLHIPVIALYQRPVYMSRFAVAQADFFAVFEQNDLRDLKTSQQFVKAAKAPNGENISVFSSLPKYHCLWYDVGEGETVVLKPGPDKETILKTFKRRLLPRKIKALT